jgi:TIR domain-containing protein
VLKSFISHIHEDQIVARALERFLVKKLGATADIFVSLNLSLGDEWLDKIQQEMKSARVVLALFSPEAIARPWVNFELGAWFADGKTLVPLCIGGVEPANLPKPYSNIQGTKLEDSASLWQLVQAIWKLLEISGITPPPFGWADEDVNDFLRELDRWSKSRKL